MITPHHPERMRTRACDQEDGRSRPYVINEDLFRQVLIRERKRSDRSNQSFVFLLLDMDDGMDADSSTTSETLVEALAAAKREMDVLGWLEWRPVIGILAAEICASDPVNACERLEIRVRRELARRLDVGTVARLSIRVPGYPAPKGVGGDPLRPADRLLHR